MPNFIRMEVKGHAGEDVNLKESKAGKKYARFGLCLNLKRGKREETQWVQVLVFNEIPLAQAAHVRKGDAIEVRGMPFADKYISARTQQPVATLNVFADELYILDWHKRGDQPPPPEQPDPEDGDLPF